MCLLLGKQARVQPGPWCFEELDVCSGNYYTSGLNFLLMEAPGATDPQEVELSFC